MRQIILYSIIFLVFLTSCSLDNVMESAVSKIDNSVEKVKNIWVKDACQTVYQDRMVEITSKNISNYYLVYISNNENTKADFALWKNLENNRIIELEKINTSYRITNLQPPSIEICTSMPEEMAIKEISKPVKSGSARKFVAHDLV